MARFIFACLLIGSCCHAAIAAESVPSVTAPRYLVKVRYLRIDGGKKTIAVETEVTGTKGTPLKADLAKRDGMVLKLHMRELPGGTPSRYVAYLKLVESKNGKEIVLSAPMLIVTAERPAKLMVGQEKGDRIEVDLTVRDVAAASSYGTSLMNRVNIPIIIQDEEEEKLGVTPSP